MSDGTSTDTSSTTVPVQPAGENATVANIEKVANGYIVSHCTEQNLQDVENAVTKQTWVRTLFTSIEDVLAHLTSIGL